MHFCMSNSIQKQALAITGITGTPEILTGTRKQIIKPAGWGRLYPSRKPHGLIPMKESAFPSRNTWTLITPKQLAAQLSDYELPNCPS